MTPAQRFAMAADMLVSGRNRDGLPFPADSLITTFEESILTVCEGTDLARTQTVAEIAVGLYMTSSDFKQ